MADSTDTKTDEEGKSPRGNRKFAVSANRGKASHKLRYVEAGGAAIDTEECTFCQVVPELSGRDEKTDKPGS